MSFNKHITTEIFVSIRLVLLFIKHQRQITPLSYASREFSLFKHAAATKALQVFKYVDSIFVKKLFTFFD